VQTYVLYSLSAMILMPLTPHTRALSQHGRGRGTDEEERLKNEEEGMARPMQRPSSQASFSSLGHGPAAHSSGESLSDPGWLQHLAPEFAKVCWSPA
jgi:hypothetical protein